MNALKALPPTTPWLGLSSRPSAPSRASLKVVLFSLFISPLAFGLMYLSTASLISSAASGIPLSSYTGMAGVLVASLLLLLVSSIATYEPIALHIATGWSAVIAVTALVFQHLQAMGDPPQVRANGLFMAVNDTLSWSYLPTLVFFVCLGCSISLRLVQSWHRQDSPLGMPWRMRGKTGQTGALSIVVSSSLAIGLWITLVYQAPTNLGIVATQGAQGLAAWMPPPAVIITSLALVFLLAATSSYSTLGIAAAGLLFMAVPGQIIMPLWMTLSGQVATPTMTSNTAIALVSPVVATLGVVLLAMSAPIHFTRRADASSIT